MFFLKSVYCRIFQGAFRIAMPLLPYRDPEIISSCNDIGEVLFSKDIHSALIITDRGILSCGLTEPVKTSLENNRIVYTVFSDTCPNPTVDNVEAALTLYKENSCQCIIAIGGGSAMDCAKAVGARVVYPRRSVGQLKGVMRVLRSLPTLIAVPTTAGTGSEITPAALITDTKKQHKYALMSFPIIPHYAVLDPALTYSLPKILTATTGMDALTHATEAYIGRSTTKETRQLSLETTSLVFSYLEKAFEDGHDREAREAMLHAACKAGKAFAKSYVGYVHAIAHSLGGKYGTPHGLANAVIMPYVLDLYGKSAWRKLHELGVAAGVASKDDSHRDGAEKYISAIRDMNSRLGIPDKLSGIAESDIPEMSAHAEKEANPLYPVPRLMTREELEKIYYMISDRRS